MVRPNKQPNSNITINGGTVKSELPTDPDGTAGTAVVITKGDKSLMLINPDGVTYWKKEE